MERLMAIDLWTATEIDKAWRFEHWLKNSEPGSVAWYHTGDLANERDNVRILCAGLHGNAGRLRGSGRRRIVARDGIDVFAYLAIKRKARAAIVDPFTPSYRGIADVAHAKLMRRQREGV